MPLSSSSVIFPEGFPAYRTIGEHLLTLFDYLLTVILPQISNMCLRIGHAQDISQPVIGILSGHVAALIKLIEIMVCFIAKPPKLPVCRNSHRDPGAPVNAHIGITSWIVLTYIKHLPLRVLMIDSFCTAKNGMTAAVRAFWCCIFYSLSFLFQNGIPPNFRK
jgi:hypothetical protein